jgi:hypothetical protein
MFFSTMTKPNLNFYLYRFGLARVHAAKRLIPIKMMPHRVDLSGQFVIGITTYVERYDHFFKPLYESLSYLFPDVPIVITVNGFPDSNKQLDYLARIQSELCDQAPSHHIFVLHDRPRGLTTLWNEMLQVAENKPLWILNDDLRVDSWIRRWAEKFNWNNVDLTLLNDTWSHFIISAKVVNKVGIFEPSFLGIGFEDMDYTARLGLAGVAISNIPCPYLHHCNHQPERTSFDDVSGRTWGKYTTANEEYFYRLWAKSSDGEGVYIKQIRGFVKPVQPLSPVSLSSLKPLQIQQGLSFPDRQFS